MSLILAYFLKEISYFAETLSPIQRSERFENNSFGWVKRIAVY